MSKQDSPNVLVTGGSGFIGTWVLRELLSRGARPIVVDLEPAPQRWQRVLGEWAREVVWAEGSLTDPESLRSVIARHEVSHIIHLAALLTPACQQDPFRGCEVNVLGSTSVFEAARRSQQIRSISYASSYGVYGDGSSEESSSPEHPPYFYGAFKLAVDLIAEQYWKHFKLPSVAIRPHVVYGPERDQGLTAGPSLAIRAAARGEIYTIGYTGEVGYDYVEDVARAFVRAALECMGGVAVVDLPSEPASTEDFVREIESVVPEAAGRITVDGAKIPMNVPSDPHFIMQLFRDWETTSLKEGVRKTVEFYRRGVSA